MKKLLSYFSKFEIALWLTSVLLITAAFLIFDRSNYTTLIGSLIGITAIIFCAKGNPLGQILMIGFSLFYGVVSYTFAYYGEMITYLGMTMPIAALALVSWLKNPYKGKKAEVKIGRIGKVERILIIPAVIAGTVALYFLLRAFDTTNLYLSTFSVTTSLLAAYLTFRRSPYFALAYVLNDIVLIVMWLLASITDIHYVSVLVCFVAFLLNDLYSFFNWQRMKKRQSDGKG